MTELEKVISGARQICLVSHTHPDGDALGSVVGLGSYLIESKGKSVKCILPTAPADNLMFMVPEGFPLSIAEDDTPAALDIIKGCDLLMVLDCSGLSRTDFLEEHLRKSTAFKVLMDHHVSPETGDFGMVFSKTEISSACELIYWILRDMEGGTLPQATRTALLAGMTTDTNNFANSVFPSTFAMASELIEAGTDRDYILSAIYQQYRENRIRLMGWMQSSNMVVLPCGAAYMILDADTQKRFDYKEGDSEGLVNIPLGIAGVKLSVMLKQTENGFRVSIRSRRGTSARDLAVRSFHGGGHENASGGKLDFGTDIANAGAASAYVEQAIKEYLK